MSALKELAKQPLPPTDEIAGRWVVQTHDHLTEPSEYERITGGLRFGKDFSDYMAHSIRTHAAGWGEKAIKPYGPLSVTPGTAVLHYGQEIFGGLKTCRREDDSIWMSRPGFNAYRSNQSARCLALSELPVEDFMGSCADLVRADTRWVPTTTGTTLYLRPVMHTSQDFLEARLADEVTYFCVASPSGPYFKSGFAPVSIYVSQEFHRVGPGGIGAAKTSGNYAGAMQAQVIAQEQGYDQVCFLDAVTGTYLDELGGMNVFVVYQDGHVVTPALAGCILEDSTRATIIQLLRDEGVEVREARISLLMLLGQTKSGKVMECSACGTAAVVTPIGRLSGEGFDVEIPVGTMTKHIYDLVTGTRWGTAEDTHGQRYRVK